MKVFWTRPALNDLEGIVEDTAERAHATQLVVRIITRVFPLGVTPWIGRPGRAPGTRELVLAPDPWIVPYRVVRGQVEVLRVLHTSRAWPRTLH